MDFVHWVLLHASSGSAGQAWYFLHADVVEAFHTSNQSLQNHVRRARKRAHTPVVKRQLTSGGVGWGGNYVDNYVSSTAYMTACFRLSVLFFCHSRLSCASRARKLSHSRRIVRSSRHQSFQSNCLACQHRLERC